MIAREQLHAYRRLIERPSIKQPGEEDLIELAQQESKMERKHFEDTGTERADRLEEQVEHDEVEGRFDFDEDEPYDDE